MSSKAVSKYEFNEKEVENKKLNNIVPPPYGGVKIQTYKFDTPISEKENLLRIANNEMPLWLPVMGGDINFIQPLVMPDALARWKGGKDWFGIEWEYEPLTNAAMVKPGTRRLSDITKWKEELVFPDLNDIDWQKDYEENYKDALDPTRATMFAIVNGLFERTADLTSFEDTFCYLLEEEEALGEFYDKLADWLIDLFKIAKEVYHADIIIFHDDMGTQRSSFFSPSTFEEVMLPPYKKIVDAAHEMGLLVSFHSCGSVENQIENFIKVGFDFWEGQDCCNDKIALLEKYGDKLPQVSAFSPDPEGQLSDEEYEKALIDRIKEFGKDGRYVMWYREPNQERYSKGQEIIYRESRKFYCGE
ncbi:uroporphyrinogen decarboxylase family protein [Terrisporobacter mayombei]|uniref:Uroporphyrinogen decarboxylase (URO-D) domain-containing protein n=1 Tax=Terrisporobacter mayombei TaxID=1541 RepID=A0ABY9Q2G3_9FIRM|nr:uroporphyrinogen decarboxylase family protein [Terrisporobacter mayombei]MCC3868615.1 hypothetical protein [Terrisporobacter mayombei]WMT80772.1 hypothetical protein TEMA_10940 [Terrisporobacter mayombei]